jgi:radical SAM enzyme (TIGR01210 family)
MPPRSTNDPRRPISVWKEKDSINGKLIDVLVVILNGPGCSWYKEAGCTMCGYNVDCGSKEIDPTDLDLQIQFALNRYDDEPYIKIFTSGSFMDPKEIPFKAQDDILKKIANINPNVRLLVESRPEFIKTNRLYALTQSIRDIEIAIGLETGSDRIRAENIRKGFTWDDYLNAGRKIVDNDLKLKTYLLLKPPFLGEMESIEDSISSITSISQEFPGSRISINPMNIQSGTDVEKLYKKRLYRPPWLWSLIEVMKRGYENTDGSVHLMSSPTAGGKKRGAHNCGICDEVVLRAIDEFSISNNIDIITGLSHDCMKKWKEYLVQSTSYPR